MTYQVPNKNRNQSRSNEMCLFDDMCGQGFLVCQQTEPDVSNTSQGFAVDSTAR